MPSPSPHRLAVLQAAFVTFLWSTSWVLIKIGLEEMPALLFAGLRYAIASVILLGVAWSRPQSRAALRRLGRSDWLRLGTLGLVFYALTQGAQFAALAYLPAVTLSLVLCFTPALVALLGASILGESLTRLKILGVGLFLLGASIYLVPRVAVTSAVGLAVAGLGLAANATASLLGRSVNRTRELSPLVVTVVSMGIGSLLLLAAGLLAEGLPALGLRSWAIVLWLAVVNTAVAFTLWNRTLQSLSALESSLINNTMLIQIAALAWLFLGESIGGRGMLGLLLALGGVVLVQWPSRPGPAARRSSAA